MCLIRSPPKELMAYLKYKATASQASQADMQASQEMQDDDLLRVAIKTLEQREGTDGNISIGCLLSIAIVFIIGVMSDSQ